MKIGGVFSSAAVLGAFAVVVACSSSSGSTNAGGDDAGGAGDASSVDGGKAIDGGGAADSGGDGGLTGTAAPWKSGTRLRAVLETAGTSKRFLRWHDTTTNDDCTFAPAGDAKVRCLPSGNLAYVYYDDDKCTNPVGAYPKSDPTPKYVQGPYGALVCHTGPDLYTPGAPYVPAAIYSSDGFSCTKSGSVDSAKITYVHLGAVVPASTWATETEAIAPRGTRVSALQYVTADGASQDHILLDGARGMAPCDVMNDFRVKSAPYYCTPHQLAYLETYFTDAACNTPAAFYPGYAQQTCGLAPTAVLDSTIDSVGKPVAYFEPGTLIKTPVYQGTPGMCAVFNSPPQLYASFYSYGTPIPVTSFPLLSTANEGAGRIQLSVVRTDSGAYAGELGFYDTAKNVKCVSQPTTDGKMRCLPRTDYTTNLFTDNLCTQGIYQSSGGVTPPAAGAFVSAPTTSGTQQVFAVGATAAVPAMVWQVNSTTCDPAGLDVTATFNTLTTVPPSDFAEVVVAPE